MKKIYIIATNNSTMVSRFFKIMTKERYVHISIALDKKCKKVYSFARKNIKHPLPAGFVIEDFDNICKLLNYSYCRVYEMEISNNQYYKLKSELKHNYIKNSNKYRYNLIGLPMIGFNFSYNRKYHHTCSSFCGKLLMDSGIIDFKKDYSLIKPMDFYKLENTKLIFEGKTFDYLNNIAKT